MSETSLLRWKAKLRNAWEQGKHIYSLGRCFKSYMQLQTSEEQRGTCHIHGGSVLVIEQGHGPLHEGKGTKALLVAGCL